MTTTLQIRPATPDDAKLIVRFVRELAVYEKAEGLQGHYVCRVDDLVGIHVGAGRRVRARGARGEDHIGQMLPMHGNHAVGVSS